MSDTVKLMIEINNEDYNSILKTSSLLEDRASNRIDNKLFRAIKNGTIITECQAEDISVLEDIKLELQYMNSAAYMENYNVGLRDAIKVIDKHMKSEG